MENSAGLDDYSTIGADPHSTDAFAQYLDSPIAKSPTQQASPKKSGSAYNPFVVSADNALNAHYPSWDGRLSHSSDANSDMYIKAGSLPSPGLGASVNDNPAAPDPKPHLKTASKVSAKTTVPGNGSSGAGRNGHTDSTFGALDHDDDDLGGDLKQRRSKRSRGTK